MKDRTLNPNTSRYHHYGGRGIEMYAEWQTSFQAFFAYIGPKPTPQHSLERIDNEKGYFPGNVRWATQREQCNNTRSNRLLTFQGRTQTVAQWSRETGIKGSVLYGRIRRNWTVDEALTATVQKKGTVC